MKRMNRKGIGDVNALYGLVLIIALIGIIAAVSLVVLQNLYNSSAVTNPTNSSLSNVQVQTAINSTITGVGAIPNTWLGLIVTIAVLVVIVVLLIKGFSTMGGGARR